MQIINQTLLFANRYTDQAQAICFCSHDILFAVGQFNKANAAARAGAPLTALSCRKVIYRVVFVAATTCTAFCKIPCTRQYSSTPGNAPGLTHSSIVDVGFLVPGVKGLSRPYTLCTAEQIDPTSCFHKLSTRPRTIYYFIRYRLVA